MIDADLATLPIASVCSDDCALFLWTCWPMLKRSLEVIESWGFTYKTLGFDWVKCNQNGTPRINLGYWTRANSEPCLLATRGKPKRLDKGVSQVIVSGLGEHSEKPEEMYSRIERLVEGPYLELFHRPRNGLFPPRDGWTFAGNECEGNLDMKDALEELATR
jgi:N6-adenosine-specific RNA methylase IME4